MNQMLKGAMAGAGATVPMTLVLAGAKAAGLVGKPPPKQITQRAAARIGLRVPGTSQRTARASWLATHFGFGAAAGSVYALGNGRLPVAWPQQGLAFGAALWAANYLGLMPALGLYPSPDDDSKPRLLVMVIAHLVYGLSLAAALAGDKDSESA